VSGFTTVVFAGPTIAHATLRDMLDQPICRPPVAMGDVYRCLDHDPRCIAIIDGYFDGVPSVWHKEILYAMARGVHVLGASSMGALRAAELADFGMRGVGEIFAQFQRGELEDDDEVAVLHAPAQLEFAAVSEAMVNIRATLNAALANAVLDTADCARLTALAKSCFYHDRNWEHILSLAEPAMQAQALDRFRSWLPAGAVDQKRLDALALLREVERLQAARPPPFRAAYRFEWSEMWQHAIAHQFPERGQLTESDDGVLDEVRLVPDEYAAAVVQAGFHCLAQQGAAQDLPPVDDAGLRRVFNDFRERNGLLDRSRLNSWLADNELNDVEFERLMEALARRERLVDGCRDRLDHAMLDWLKLDGRYPALRARAEQKHLGLQDSGLRLTDAEKPGLLRWYFEQRLALPVPLQIDPVLQRGGFRDREHFYRAIFAEWVYLSRSGRPMQ